jgi:uncharacterized protein YkwD
MFLRCLALAAVVGALWASSAAAAVAEDGESEAMVDAVNAARAERGLRALRHHSALSRSSTAFAGSLMRRGAFGHADRILAGGGFPRLGEALAHHRGGRPRLAATVRRWLASPPHRALVLSRSFGWVGAGRSVGRLGGARSTIWVLQLGGR